MADRVPPTVEPADTGWLNHFRLVHSQFPPIPVFEQYVDPDLLHAAFQIEARTNERLRNEVGELSQVARDDYLLGPGATPVMAAFTHIGRDSRFTDGSFGVYYAAKSIDTAIAEVAFHRARFLSDTDEPATKITLRSYSGKLRRPLLDIRGPEFEIYRDPDIATYPRCQAYSAGLRETAAWGLLYLSVRHDGGECVALYRPPAVGIPSPGKHYEFHWDGAKINAVYELRSVR